jgi:hypothetical protein
MNLNRRLQRLEDPRTGNGTCPACRGVGGPMLRVEFENGDPPVEEGFCPHCKGVGGLKLEPRRYRLPSRAMYERV